MRFYNREIELEALEKAYLKSGSDFIVGYGYFFFR
jgi:AAA+ ATPase superfamily predicted ATPase